MTDRSPSSPPPASDDAPPTVPRRASRSWPSQIAADVDVLEPAPGSGVSIGARGGTVRVAVDCALERGMRCVLRVLLPSGMPLLLRGTVTWSRPLQDGCVAVLALVAGG
ncbi:MAG: hypothetical protein HY744_04130 [Deltaproteobacteria bacterium]|nr:hypothetical protein [Deltaproteobacteria bacterium]